MSVPSVAGPPAGRARAPPSPGAPGSARGLPAGARSARPPPAARGRFAARPAAPRDPGTFSAGSWLPSSPSFCVSSNFLPDKPGLTLCSPSSPVPSVFHSLSLGLSLPSMGTFSPFSVYVLLRLRDACCFCYRHWGPRAPQDRNGEEPGEFQADFLRLCPEDGAGTEDRAGRGGAGLSRPDTRGHGRWPFPRRVWRLPLPGNCVPTCAAGHEGRRSIAAPRKVMERSGLPGPWGY